MSIEMCGILRPTIVSILPRSIADFTRRKRIKALLQGSTASGDGPSECLSL